MFSDCICTWLDGFNTEFYRAKVVKARKPHTCVECGAPISPADRYERSAGKCDGSVWSAATCLTCSRIRESLFRCGFTVGSMWADIHETFCVHADDDGGPFCICPTRRA